MRHLSKNRPKRKKGLHLLDETRYQKLQYI